MRQARGQAALPGADLPAEAAAAAVVVAVVVVLVVWVVQAGLPR